MIDIGTRQEAQEKALKAKLLILDDFGKEFRRLGDYGDTFWEKVMSDREGNRRATVITSNLDADALAERFSKAVVDGCGRVVAAGSESEEGCQ